MAHVVLITGGSRSGKSEFARKKAESLGGSRAFVATCPRVDEEMEERIRKHQQMRRTANWHTVEETVDLARALRDLREFDVLLVDCLTLWINNLLFRAQERSLGFTEEDVARKCLELREICLMLRGTVFFVTNEVGMGIVPGDPATRHYRDLMGKCNQTVAQWADEVILLACGLPLELKKGGPQ